MPYKNPEDRRKYMREYQRRRRAGLTGSKQTTPRLDLPLDVRIETAEDILRILEWAFNLITSSEAEDITRARAIGYLAGVALRAIEVVDIAARLEELERIAGER